MPFLPGPGVGRAATETPWLPGPVVGRTATENPWLSQHTDIQTTDISNAMIRFDGRNLFQLHQRSGSEEADFAKSF